MTATPPRTRGALDRTAVKSVPVQTSLSDSSPIASTRRPIPSGMSTLPRARRRSPRRHVPQSLGVCRSRSYSAGFVDSRGVRSGSPRYRPALDRGGGDHPAHARARPRLSVDVDDVRLPRFADRRAASSGPARVRRAEDRAATDHELRRGEEPRLAPSSPRPRRACGRLAAAASARRPAHRSSSTASESRRLRRGRPSTPTILARAEGAGASPAMSPKYSGVACRERNACSGHLRDPTCVRAAIRHRPPDILG